MIVLKNVFMQYPLPRGIRRAILKPFAPAPTTNALHDINLTVETGDRIALLGPNGAGKSTMLKLISGLLLPTSGSVEVNGHSTAAHNTLARRSVGMVMNEERSFFWRLTGRQNLHFFGTLDNLHGQQLEEKIETLIELVGLGHAADKQVQGYSSGMKQRLAMARGLISEPNIIILDEPTRTLDPMACEDLIELILNRIHGNNKTLLIATHRLDEAQRLCNKVLAIRKGNIIECDTIDSVIERYSSLQKFYKQCMTEKEAAL